jgi:hypothetical protein
VLFGKKNKATDIPELGLAPTSVNQSRRTAREENQRNNLLLNKVMAAISLSKF